MNPMNRVHAVLIAVVFVLFTLPCFCATAPSLEERLQKLEASAAPAISSGDNAWMLASSALVLMMTAPGLILFYGGLVRRKNVLATMMHSLVLMALMSAIWVVYGYSLAFSEGNPFFGGMSCFLLNGVGTAPNGDYAATIPHQSFMLFQMMFIIITPALISGAIAERMKFSAYLWFMILWVTVVYLPLAHMVWGAGGLFNWALGGKIPVLDFAGGTVVHISSGVAALVCAAVLGKRQGFPREAIFPHNVVFCLIGTGLLWVGWFGFNAGSDLAAGGLAASAFAATHFSAAAGTLAWAGMDWITPGKPSVLGACSGAVAGLVCITPASGFVQPMPAIGMGLAAGVVYFYACSKLKGTVGFDDSLDAFGVHGVAGTLGAILTGVFATRAVGDPAIVQGNLLGILEGGDVLKNQIMAAVITWVLAGVVTFILLK